MKEKSKRGFANMNPEKRREIARMGGTKVSENRIHMAQIGKKGGDAVVEKRGILHMSTIGQKGGKANGRLRAEAKKGN